MEQKIIKALASSRSIWERARDLINPYKEMSSEGSNIYDRISEYYNNDPDAASVDIELLCAQIERNTSSVKLAEAICKTLRNLPEDVSNLNIVKELLDLKRHNLGQELSGMLAAGRAKPEEIQKRMEEYLGLEGTADDTESEVEELNSVKVTDLVQHSFNEGNLIRLSPRVLNDACDGGAKPGHHILVFAPTEMGKTLFVINMVSGFIEQKLRVLYIGNEDPAADIYMRYITRLTGRNKHDVLKEPAKAQTLLEKKGYELLTLAPLAPGNFRQINRLIDKYDPQVVILDQLRNLDVSSEGRTQQLEKAATEARNLAKRRQILVVSVTQAGDSASGKRILDRGDVDGSNVGIPGQADLMIGIGATADEEQKNERWMSFPKNKLSGNHAPIKVSIDPHTSRVIE